MSVRYTKTEARRFDNLSYAAEGEVWSGPKARKYMAPVNVADVRDHLRAVGWTLVVIDRGNARSGSSTYWPKTRRITLGKWAGWWVVWHELAHHMAHAVTGFEGDHGHDRTWRACYVAIVRMEAGDYWADRLLAAFRRHGLEP